MTQNQGLLSKSHLLRKAILVRASRPKVTSIRERQKREQRKLGIPAALKIHRIGARMSIKAKKQNKSHYQLPHESWSQIEVIIPYLTNQSHKSKSIISSVKKRSRNPNHQSIPAHSPYTTRHVSCIFVRLSQEFRIARVNTRSVIVCGTFDVNVYKQAHVQIFSMFARYLFSFVAVLCIAKKGSNMVYPRAQRAKIEKY